MDPLELLPIGISIVALVVSIFTLWKNSLEPFKLKVSYDSPTFSLYKITPEMSGSGDKTWWIPSFDMGFTFHNLGKQSGEVTDIRLVGYLNGEKSKKKFIFYAKWVVNYVRFQRMNSDRFEWLQYAVEREWYPLIIAGNEQKDLHIILEGHRWDDKYLGLLELSLEVFSSEKSKWNQLCTYKLPISTEMYDSKSTHSLRNPKLEESRGKQIEWDGFPINIQSK